MKYINYILTLIICVVFFGQCKGQESTIDKYIFKDCNIYKIIVNSDNYSYKIALSGKCDSLSFEDYYSDYEQFLDAYDDSITIKVGQKILIEFYDKLLFTEKNLAQLKGLTESSFDINTSIADSWNKGIEFRVDSIR